MQPRLLITARTHPLRAVDRLRQSVRQGQSFASTTAMLAELMQDQGRVLEHIVREATDMEGVPTTLPLLEEISHDEVFGSGRYTTSFLTERADHLPSLGGGGGR